MGAERKIPGKSLADIGSILVGGSIGAGKNDSIGTLTRSGPIAAARHGPAHAGASPETQLHLELQNMTAAAGAPLQVYFKPFKGLRCELVDSAGNAAKENGFGSGGGPGTSWVTLPYDSNIRLRANMYGYGRNKGDSLTLCSGPVIHGKFSRVTKESATYRGN